MSTAVPDQPTPLPSPLDFVVGERQRREVDTTVPILPEWLRDRVAFLSTARRFAQRNGYRAGRWSANLPAIVLLLLLYSPRGLARVTVSLSRYLYDWDSAQVRHQHAGNTETPEYVRAQNIRKANLKARWMVASAVTVVTVGPVLAWTAPNALAWIVAPVMFVWIVKMIPGKEFWEYIVAFGSAALVWWKLPHWLALVPDPPWWLLPAVGTAAVLALGWVGRPQNRKLVDPSQYNDPLLEKPSADLVIDALVAAVPGITDKNRDAIRIHAPGVARARAGYHLSLEVPPGVTTSDVLEEREAFAAALRRQMGCVWIKVGHLHPGHMHLYIGDEPMATAEQAPWRLMDGKRIDIFEKLPLFTDQEGRWVDQRLAYTALVIGGAPGFGKSFAMRELACAVALDPRVKLKCYDGKGNGDLRPLRLVADEFFEDDDDEGIREQLSSLMVVREEMRARARFLRDLPAAENPEDKVTSELVDKYRSKLAPIVLVFDEVQVYTEYDDKEIKDAFVAIMADIVRRGRSAGIIPIFCTQKPAASVIPSIIVDNCSTRLCFRVNGQRANDAVLGNEMHSRGIKATKFGPDDKGLAWLKGDGAEPLVVRTVHGMDKPTSERLMVKARAMRERLGMLTGYAAGEEAEDEQEQVEFLEDCRTAMDLPPVPAMHLSELCKALAELRPATWGNLDNNTLGGMLREAGVKVGTVWSRQLKDDGKGVKREWLNIAATSDENPADEGGAVLAFPTGT